MISRRASHLAASLMLGFCLSGCVAAALPAVAAAGMLRGGNDAKEAEATETPPPDQTAIAVTANDAAALAEDMMAGVKTQSGPVRPVGTAVGELSSSAPSPYTRLFEYAADQIARDNDKQPLMSAILSNPSALDAKRQPCAKSTPLVLIDLDPHDGKLAADDARAVAPSVAQGLQQLRDMDIAIAWISQGTAGDAGAIRTALTRTGLDPEGKDRLVLMRYPDDRKQTRRDELAQDHCILAIAGDNREDFDELYEYLRKPEAGASLEQLVGNGWFLVPPALGAAPTPQLSSKEPDQ